MRAAQHQHDLGVKSRSSSSTFETHFMTPKPIGIAGETARTRPAYTPTLKFPL